MEALILAFVVVGFTIIALWLVRRPQRSRSDGSTRPVDPGPTAALRPGPQRRP